MTKFVTFSLTVLVLMPWCPPPMTEVRLAIVLNQVFVFVNYLRMYTHIYLMTHMLLYSKRMQIAYVHGLRQPRLVQQIVWLCDLGNYYMPLLPLTLQLTVQNLIHFQGVQKITGFPLTGRNNGNYFMVVLNRTG